LVLVASCEDGGTTPSAVPQSVAVVLVQTGVGYQAAATAAFRDGSSREVTTEAQWDSTDTLVATVDALGRITVRGVGTTDITATYQGISGRAALTVATLPPVPQGGYTLSGALRDALDGLATSTGLDDPDVCCLVEILSADGSTQRLQYSRANYAFAGVPAGNIQITVRPYLGWAEQTRVVNVTTDTIADFALVPQPLRLWGEIADPRTEARGPACVGLVEILDGPNAGLAATTTPPAPDFEFAEVVAPGTATLRFSAPGGYTTVTRSVRLRGDYPFGSDVSGRRGAALECPGCPIYSAMTCS
jgi:hypothetical protein